MDTHINSDVPGLVKVFKLEFKTFLDQLLKSELSNVLKSIDTLKTTLDIWGPKIDAVLKSSDSLKVVNKTVKNQGTQASLSPGGHIDTTAGHSNTHNRNLPSGHTFENHPVSSTHSRVPDPIPKDQNYNSEACGTGMDDAHQVTHLVPNPVRNTTLPKTSPT